VSHHIIFITACAQNVRLQQERKRYRQTLTPLINSTFNNHVRAAHSLLTRRFSSSRSEILVR